MPIWEISGDEIARAADRIEFGPKLPILVRKLIAATVPEALVDMPGDGGTRLHGFDGVVESPRPAFTCPEGRSVWELSVNADPRRKAEEDFVTRTKSAHAELAAQTTYVAVTARRWDARKWVDEKKLQGLWRDVVAVTADQLATWVERVPAVAVWLAEIIGRPTTGLIDVASFLGRWQRRTSRNLPTELLTLGRERIVAAERLRATLLGAPTQIRISGSTIDEPAVFAAAVIDQIEEKHRDHWLARTVVVETQDGLRMLRSMAVEAPLLLLPTFALEVGAAPTGQFCVIPSLEAGAREGVLRLQRIPYLKLAKVLESSGWLQDEAARFAKESGGDLIALQRMAGFEAAPSWPSRHSPHVLGAMLLVGSWTEANAADRSALNGLGVTNEELEQAIIDLAHDPERPLVRDQNGWHGEATWRWSAPTDAWNRLAPRLPRSTIDRFAELAGSVLSVSPTVAVTDGTPDAPLPLRRHSHALRNGIGDSLVRLSLADDLLGELHSAHRGADLAARIVRDALPSTSHAWAFLGELLIHLAEAAPTVFLDALEASLRATDGVNELLKNDQHTALLWAIETLGWDPELVSRCALALARLALRDDVRTGGRIANRPSASLLRMLHPWFPGTDATIAQRLDAFRNIGQREPKMGRALARSILQVHSGLGILFSHHRPVHRRGAPERSEPVPPSEREESLQLAVSEAIRLSGTDLSAWADLLEPARLLSREHNIRLLDAALAATRDGRDVDQKLRWAANDRLNLERRSSRMDADVAERLETLRRLLEPTETDERIAWVFEPKAGAHVDYNEGRLTTAIADAVAQIRSSEDMIGIVRKIASPERARSLGVALGNADLGPDLEHAILETSDAQLSLLIPWFAAALSIKRGKQWLAQLVLRLAIQDNVEQVVGIASCLPREAALWDLVEAQGDRFRSAYWGAIDWVGGDLSDGEWSRAVNSLLDAKNPATAFQVASHRALLLDPETLFRVLEDLAASADAKAQVGKSGIDSYGVGKIFEALDAAMPNDSARTLTLEFVFLRWLQDTPRGARALALALESSPDLFLAFIRLVFRPEGQPLAEVDEATAQRAEAAFEVLHQWNTFPGHPLASDSDETALRSWANRVLKQATVEGYGGGAQYLVAEVLTRPKAGVDGVWPCATARELIESEHYPDIASLMETAKWNARGAHSRGVFDGGEQERVLRDEHRRAAVTLRGVYPHTAAMLDKLATTYDREADEQDAKAKARRMRAGVDGDETAS